jgi:hypothetical protein
MKFTLRFVWYVLRIVILAASAFAILVVAFFVAKDSANVYVIVTDGMKARASSILMPNQESSLSKYFTSGFIKSQTKNSDYADFLISDFTYKLSVESLWCNPWKKIASVTVVESIPSIISSSTSADTSTDSTKKAPVPPQWPRARYTVNCIRVADYWRIDSITKVESLQPEPTPSPEPSTYITASPVPTSTTTPGATGSLAPTATK